MTDRSVDPDGAISAVRWAGPHAKFLTPQHPENPDPTSKKRPSKKGTSCQNRKDPSMKTPPPSKPGLYRRGFMYSDEDLRLMEEDGLRRVEEDSQRRRDDIFERVRARMKENETKGDPSQETEHPAKQFARHNTHPP